MRTEIQFWFDFASTYSYLSAMRIEQEAAEKDIPVSWQPLLLGPIFAEQGWNNSPFNIYPAKGRYMWRDMERLCKARGLPLKQPDTFPANSLKAARLASAIGAPDQRAAFSRAVFSAQFGEGRDISSDECLTRCLDVAGLPAETLARTQDSDVKTALFDQVARAKAHDIFGAPSFVVNNELFWGDDRLNDAISEAVRI